MRKKKKSKQKRRRQHSSNSNLYNIENIRKKCFALNKQQNTFIFYSLQLFVTLCTHYYYYCYMRIRRELIWESEKEMLLLHVVLLLLSLVFGSHKGTVYTHHTVCIQFYILRESAYPTYSSFANFDSFPLPHLSFCLCLFHSSSHSLTPKILNNFVWLKNR